jgi:hypothetical protein
MANGSDGCWKGILESPLGKSFFDSFGRSSFVESAAVSRELSAMPVPAASAAAINWRLFMAISFKKYRELPPSQDTVSVG